MKLQGVEVEILGHGSRYQNEVEARECPLVQIFHTLRIELKTEKLKKIKWKNKKGTILRWRGANGGVQMA